MIASTIMLISSIDSFVIVEYFLSENWRHICKSDIKILSHSFEFVKSELRIKFMGRKSYKYDKILCKNFGSKVFVLRKDNGLTQADLAFEVGISTSYLSSIERGTTDSTISTAKRLAKALKTNMNELFIFK